jgi:hypothetical protein
MSKIGKRLGYLVIAIALLIGIGVEGAIQLKKYIISSMTEGDITAAFAEDLYQYVVASNGNLPRNWEDFLVWEDQQKNSSRWKNDDLTKRFLIKETHVYPGMTEHKYIEVLDPSIKSMEGYINRRIQEAPQ